MEQQLEFPLTYIFLFVLFGAFLNRTGMGQLFNDSAMAIAGKSSGGPAKVAVISSGFLRFYQWIGNC